MFVNNGHKVWLRGFVHKGTDNTEEETHSFRDDLYIFLNSTICHCYRHCSQIDRSNIERYKNVKNSFNYLVN